MEEETKPPFIKQPTNGSQIGKVSVRAWIVLLIVLSVCVKSFLEQKVEEPLYSLVLLTVGYYFGQNQRQPLR